MTVLELMDQRIAELERLAKQAKQEAGGDGTKLELLAGNLSELRDRKCMLDRAARAADAPQPATHAWGTSPGLRIAI